MKILYDQVAIRPKKAEGVSKGGIALPEQATDTPDRGTVEAKGPWVSDDVNVGDLVVFGKYGGQEMTNGILIMPEVNLLAVIDEE